MRKTAYNSTFVIDGVSDFTNGFVVTKSLIFRINNCFENSADRKSTNRNG